MARPQKGGDDKRDIMIRFRLTAAEKIKLQEYAQTAGLTPSDFIRIKTIGGVPFIRKATPEREALISGLAQLGKIGSNLNQVAKALNMRQEDGRPSEVSKELVEYAIFQVETLTTQLLKLVEYDGHSRK